MRYFIMLLHFFIGDGAKDQVTAIISLLSLAAFIVTPISLIRAKKSVLLHIIFTPLITIILCDHFRIYPFSPTTRNNLFLFLGIAITYAYFVQILANFYNEVFKDLPLKIGNKKIILLFLRTTIPLIVIIATIYVTKRNFFRDTNPGCVEFSIKKSDINLAINELDKRNNANNVFVTVARNIWHYRLQNGDQNHITILTKNLAKFENDKITIYFMEQDMKNQ